jgi:hypothetical protein
MKRQIVQHFALLLVCVFTLAGCKLPSVTPPDFETIAQRQLQALEPCIGIVVVRQDVEAFKACAFDAVRESASLELAHAIDDLLAQTEPSVRRIVLAAFDVKTTKELGFLVVKWINEQLTPRTLEDVLYGMLGMARAQTLEPVTIQEPKGLEDIKVLFTPEVIALLLSLLTVPLTRGIKNTFHTDGYETVIVNVALKSFSTGITMVLAGQATVAYVLVWITVTVLVDQAVYLGSVKPEKNMK